MLKQSSKVNIPPYLPPSKISYIPEHMFKELTLMGFLKHEIVSLYSRGLLPVPSKETAHSIHRRMDLMLSSSAPDFDELHDLFEVSYQDCKEVCRELWYKYKREGEPN